MDYDTFQSDPRDYIIDLLDSGRVSHKTLVIVFLKYLSHEEVREALDLNELSPRFFVDHAEGE